MSPNHEIMQTVNISLGKTMSCYVGC